MHSFEPVPATFALLSYCTRRLRLRNVVLHNCAASRADGSAVMTVPHYPAGGENYHAGGSSSHRIVSSLGRWGYEPFWLDAGRLVRRRAGDRSVNYFFLTDAHRARLAARGLLAA